MSALRVSSDIDELVRRDIGELRAMIKAMRTKPALDKLDAIEMKLRDLAKGLKSTGPT